MLFDKESFIEILHEVEFFRLQKDVTCSNVRTVGDNDEDFLSPWTPLETSLVSYLTTAIPLFLV